MANYYISGVWKNAQGEITDLFVHAINTQGGIPRGSRMGENIVLAMYNRGDRFSTIKWDYVNGRWVMGEEVRPVLRRTGGVYLRTHSNNTVTDNLDNLLRMEYFM